MKQTFCWFFEWTFGRELSLAQRSQIVAELANGLAARDTSVGELVGYVIEAAQTVLGTAQRHWPKLALESRAIWEEQFRQPEANGRGRTKAVLASIFVPGPASATVIAVPPAPMPRPHWPATAATTMAPPALPAAMPAQPTLVAQMQDDMQEMLARLTQDRLMGELRHKIKMADLQGAQKVLDNWR